MIYFVNKHPYLRWTPSNKILLTPLWAGQQGRQQELQRGLQAVPRLPLLPRRRGLRRPRGGRQHQDPELRRVRRRDLQPALHRGRHGRVRWLARRQHQGYILTLNLCSNCSESY